MKKLLITLLTLAMLLSLAACGGSDNGVQTSDDDPSAAVDNDLPDNDAGPEEDSVPPEEEEPSDVPEEAPVEDEEETPDEQTADPGQSDPADAIPDAPAEEETQTTSEVSTQPIQTEPEPEPAAPADLKAVAESLVGRPVSELYAAIGQPLSADYSPSCLDLDSDDGELTYDGFVVYTEGAPDNETVYAVF